MVVPKTGCCLRQGRKIKLPGALNAATRRLVLQGRRAGSSGPLGTGKPPPTPPAVAAAFGHTALGHPPRAQKPRGARGNPGGRSDSNRTAGMASLKKHACERGKFGGKYDFRPRIRPEVDAPYRKDTDSHSFARLRRRREGGSVETTAQTR